MLVGYMRDEEATRQAFAGGWFPSGDSCEYDASGMQIMVDRYKDIVKTGGEVVSSRRVESVAGQHPTGYETPKRVIATDTLPETVGGKVHKYRLRERYGTPGIHG